MPDLIDRNHSPAPPRARRGALLLCAIWLHLWFLSVIALVLVVTGFTGICPVYIPLKIDTNKDGED